MSNVLSLGQCAADNYMLTLFLRGNLGAVVEPVDTFDEALGRLRSGPVALVLVNRILDANGTSGLDFISKLKADGHLAQIPIMLVSNYPDAQRQAVARGALPGFGKSGLGEPETLRRLREVLTTTPYSSGASSGPKQ